MKYILATLLLTSIQPSLSYDIYLKSNEYLENCNSNPSETKFICEKDNRKILIVSNNNGYSAVEIKDNKLKSIEVDAIDDNGMLVFNSGFESKPEPRIKRNGDFYEFSKNILPIKSEFNYSEKNNDFSNLENKIKQVLDKEIKHYDSIMKSDNLKVTLENGQNKLCKRKSSMPSCPLLSCGKDKNGNQLILFKNKSISNSFHHLFSFSGNSIATNSLKLAQLKDNNGEVLVEHSTNSPNSVFSNEMTVPTKYKSNPETFELLISKAFTKPFMSQMRRCGKGAFQMFSKHISDAYDTRDNNQMVQYIDYFNHRIRSYYVNTKSLPNIKCISNGTYYNPDAYKHINKTIPKTRKTITQKEADELFKIAKNMKNMAWDVIEDGCYARGHLMAKAFEEKGVYVDKVWLDGRLKLPTNDNRYWKYHTAPVVYVEDSKGNVVETVIDPALMKAPAKLSDWTQKMGIDISKAEQASYPNPTNTKRYKGTTISITNSTPYRSDFNYKISDEEKTELAKDKLLQYENGQIFW